MAKAKKISEEEALDAVPLSAEAEHSKSVMEKILNATATPPSVDDVIEGKVIGIEKSVLDNYVKAFVHFHLVH